MKNYIKCIPLTAFATAIVLGSSLSAMETGAAGSNNSSAQQHDRAVATTSDADVETDSSMFTDSSMETGSNLSADSNVSTSANVSTDKKVSTNAKANASTTARVHSSPVTASTVLGMNIDTGANEKMGEIDEIFIDSDTGELLAIVVSTGGFIGVGDRKTLFGLREMSFDHMNEQVILGYSREQIGVLPEYKVNEQADFIELRQRMDRLASHSSTSKVRDQG